MFTDSTEGDEITPARILAMLKGQNERCPLTGLQLTAENIALDHIMPLAKGGADSMTNIRAVHKVVNTMKGTLTDGDFLHWCRLVSK
jgi:5-methylcytosine-specific restriction endonuclease McrA